MQSLLPHPLHHEVAGHPADPAPVPHVQAGVEVQRVIWAAGLSSGLAVKYTILED